MPRNWLQWIMANENKEIIKSASTNVNTNDEITSRGVTQDQGGNKYNLIKNPRFMPNHSKKFFALVE